MKIEKINDNQIRCTLTKEDLESHQIRISELAYGTDKAKKDAVKYGSTVPAEINGFATMDVIANAKAGPGTVGFGVYNVWNTDYKSVYSQSVESVYGAISSLAAQGRTYGLSYTLKY